MSKSTFPGFPTGTLKFLRDLEKNNNREWFEAHRQAYLDNVKAPMEAFAAAVSAELTKFAPAYAMEPRKAIYRVYRDTRFSANKTPYKTHVSALFYNSALGKHEAGAFYVEVSPKYVGVAAGVYMPDADSLRAIRTHILEHHTRFTRLVRGKALVECFGELQGDRLSRPPKGFLAEHPAIEWIKYKQWYYWRELDATLATSKGVLDEVVSRFRKSTPLIEFLNEPMFATKRKLAPLILDL